jgi:hypothetical protein
MAALLDSHECANQVRSEPFLFARLFVSNQVKRLLGLDFRFLQFAS